MTTKRSQNKVVEKLGIRYVQTIIENNNCIYQPISGENDQGNDCYIEFINNNITTSFCLFAQIKSGKSYKNKSGYKIPTDSNHLHYWRNHILPIAGIVYDVDLEKAYWINISEYLKTHSDEILGKSHNIRVDASNEFSAETFHLFKEHFVQYSQEYKSYENFGRSLEAFSNVNQPDECYTGLKSLFANHRERAAAWYYIILNLGNIEEKGILGNILGMLSNYLNNSTVFWRSEDYAHYQSSTTSVIISDYIKKLFPVNAVKESLKFLKDGIVQGSFPYLVFLVLNEVNDIHNIVYEFTQDPTFTMDERNSLFWVFIHFAQHRSNELTISALDDYLTTYPDNDERDLFEGIRETIITQGFIQTG